MWEDLVIPTDLLLRVTAFGEHFCYENEKRRSLSSLFPRSFTLFINDLWGICDSHSWLTKRSQCRNSKSNVTDSLISVLHQHSQTIFRSHDIVLTVDVCVSSFLGRKRKIIKGKEDMINDNLAASALFIGETRPFFMPYPRSSFLLRERRFFLCFLEYTKFTERESLGIIFLRHFLLFSFRCSLNRELRPCLVFLLSLLLFIYSRFGSSLSLKVMFRTILHHFSSSLYSCCLSVFITFAFRFWQEWEAVCPILYLMHDVMQSISQSEDKMCDRTSPHVNSRLNKISLLLLPPQDPQILLRPLDLPGVKVYTPLSLMRLRSETGLSRRIFRTFLVRHPWESLKEWQWEWVMLFFALRFFLYCFDSWADSKSYRTKRSSSCHWHLRLMWRRKNLLATEDKLNVREQSENTRWRLLMVSAREKGSQQDSRKRQFRKIDDFLHVLLEEGSLPVVCIESLLKMWKELLVVYFSSVRTMDVTAWRINR